MNYCIERIWKEKPNLKKKKKIDSWRGKIWILNASVENNIKYQLNYNTLEFEILLKAWIIERGEIET